jgi:hypothetical protein
VGVGEESTYTDSTALQHTYATEVLDFHHSCYSTLFSILFWHLFYVWRTTVWPEVSAADAAIYSYSSWPGRATAAAAVYGIYMYTRNMQHDGGARTHIHTQNRTSSRHASVSPPTGHETVN